MSGPLTDFIKTHYRHFNAASLREASEGYVRHLGSGGKMLLTLAGAMSTAEIGVSLAEMIRQGRVQAISCTGANLEEDVFNLVAHDHYERVPQWRSQTPEADQALLERHMNRVTDTCIPEEEAMRRIERAVLEEWKAADAKGESHFPPEFMWKILERPDVRKNFQIDPKDSWLVAARECNIPVFVPGWEDSTLGNIFASHCYRGSVKNPHTVRSGIETMLSLIAWYRKESKEASIGFFQIGGGIAGDFPICAVPLMRQDLQLKEIKHWGYFCQISESTTSYGSYSGAPPTEKITWDKLSVDTPSYMIESDASIVAPLMFAWILGW
jgi:deoxyhypusine synthase